MAKARAAKTIKKKVTAKVKASKTAEVEKKANELMEYHNCAQCVLMAIQEAAGLKDDVLAKAASGLAGGIGGTQSVCGALTGAALALGMKYGRDPASLKGPVDEALKKQVQVVEQVARLSKWFEREFGSTVCADLRKSHMGTELNMNVPWQNEWATQLGMRRRCTEFVAKTARRAFLMLEDPALGLSEDPAV
jgi:C_GCAxxG_C_C family probable redox protein